MITQTKCWHQLRLPATSETVPFLEEMLSKLNAVAFTLEDAKDQPIIEPPPGQAPLWAHITLCALFPHDSNPKTITQTLKQWLPKSITEHITIQPLAEQDWIKQWNQTITPQSYGQRLWICPSHHPIPAQAKVPIVLDPGLAFGTGKHATTKLCLHWLDAHISPGMTCIDYGCGSGILAIATLKLGATLTYAVDIDPQALKASRYNATQNHISPKLMPVLTPEHLPAIQVDCIIANIVSQTLIQLFDHLSSLLKPHGLMVLSGILPKQIDAIDKVFSTKYQMISQQSHDDWSLLVYQDMNTENST